MNRRLTTPGEILQTALENEEKARDFYAGLEAECSVPFVKDLLMELQNEEEKHVHMIKHMIQRLKSDKDICEH